MSYTKKFESSAEENKSLPGLTKERIAHTREQLKKIYGLQDAEVTRSNWLSDKLSEMLGEEVNIWLTRTHELEVKSFKANGAANVIFKAVGEVLDKYASGDVSTSTIEVIAASEGNHAQGVARATRLMNVWLERQGIDLKINANVYMSANADQLKKDKTVNIGTIFSKDSAQKGRQTTIVTSIEGEVYDVAEAAALKDAATPSSDPSVYKVYVPPFNHELTIEGAATHGVAIEKAIPNCDMVIAGIAGGGITNGMTRYFEGTNTEVIAAGTSVFPAIIASSLNGGEPISIRKSDDDPHPIAVGGASVKSGGDIGCALAYEHGMRIYTAHPEQLGWMLNEYCINELRCDSLDVYYGRKEVGEDPGQLPELAGVMPIAILYNNPELIRGKKNVNLVITGGNISEAKAKHDVHYAFEVAGLSKDEFPKMENLPFYDPKFLKASLESLKGDVKAIKEGKVETTPLLDSDVLEKLFDRVRNAGGKKM